VPGTAVGGSSPLGRHGHEAYPLTLTGVGDRNHLLTASVNLDNIQDVANVLETERFESARRLSF
jgi:hypothetical protein